MGMGGLQVVANLGMAVQFFSTVSLSAMARVSVLLQLV